MTPDQVEIIEIALKVLSKPDCAYKYNPHLPSSGEDRAIEKMFEALYQRPIDANTNGVHWLARTVLLMAIAHEGYFATRISFWAILFYVYSVFSTIAGFGMWWWICVSK